MMIIDKLAWIHRINNKLLLVRSHNKSHFYLPGGKRDLGESDHQALMREISEELSVDLIQSTIEPIGVFLGPADGKNDGTQVQLTCFSAHYKGELNPSSEIAELGWFSYDAMEKVSEAAKQVMHALKNDLGLLT
jgi:8-oxo-dGTP diphosphatase